jgi:HSP90 family molecular chaperone
MTRQWIEKYFLAIGISFYQSNEIRNVTRDPRIDFSFISQFGIGFLSSFQVAEDHHQNTQSILSGADDND